MRSLFSAPAECPKFVLQLLRWFAFMICLQLRICCIVIERIQVLRIIVNRYAGSSWPWRWHLGSLVKFRSVVDLGTIRMAERCWTKCRRGHFAYKSSISRHDSFYRLRYLQNFTKMLIKTNLTLNCIELYKFRILVSSIKVWIKKILILFSYMF